MYADINAYIHISQDVIRLMQLENSKRQLGMFAALGGMLVEQQRMMAIVEGLAKNQLPPEVCSSVSQAWFFMRTLLYTQHRAAFILDIKSL
jgi:hypothetical protein